ncbi:hypothetical protein EVAR_65745_1 [Eumeta japonica]|uniref:Uncharacterized protein n=1 Tax=Eumeta variegata TaxID=151549 RepID=A0A4C1SEP0_EUMVA|nr:hypothetical protein EVAR_65745_1 [Eumeta japonica]
MDTIKICFWNANGIRQHKSELEHFLTEKHRLRTPGDVELSIENFSKMMNQAVEHGSTSYQQPSFNRIFSAEQVKREEQEESGSSTDLPSIKPDLKNVQHD